MSITQLFSLICCWLLFGFFTARLAAKKNLKKPWLWFLAGMFFGLLGILLVFFIPRRESPLVQPLPPPQPAHDLHLKQWYYLEPVPEGEPIQKGPLLFSELQEAWRQKQLSPISWVWGEDMKAWQQVQDIPELHRILPQQ